MPTCRPTGTGRKSTPSLDDAWGASPPDPPQQNRYSISGIDNNPAGYTHACLPVDLPNILYCNVLAWGRAGRRAGRKVSGSAPIKVYGYAYKYISIFRSVLLVPTCRHLGGGGGGGGQDGSSEQIWAYIYITK